METGKKSEVLAQIKAEPSDQISENFGKLIFAQLKL